MSRPLFPRSDALRLRTIGNGSRLQDLYDVRTHTSVRATCLQDFVLKENTYYRPKSHAWSAHHGAPVRCRIRELP
jgi:hypothetical protein